MSSVPKKIFVVPYRNRPQHKFFLSKYLTFLLIIKRCYIKLIKINFYIIYIIIYKNYKFLHLKDFL